jgi:hypothetical protein
MFFIVNKIKVKKMQETPMLFPMVPAEFWKQIRSTIEEVVNEKINQPFQPQQQTTFLKKHF